MKNIAVTVPGEIYLEARVWAARQGTSVSSLVRQFLETIGDLSAESRDLPDCDREPPVPPPPAPVFCPNFSPNALVLNTKSLNPAWLSPLPADLAKHIRMDVQPDIRHVIKMLAGNQPDDLADRAF